MRKFILAALMAATLILFGSAKADAAFQVSITSAGTDTIIDNGAGDTNLAVGVIQANVVNNFYNISVNASVTQLGTTGTVTDNTIAVDTVSLGAATITITTSWDGFTFAPVGSTVNASSSISTSLLESGDTATVTSFVDGTTSAPLTLTGPTLNDSDINFFNDVIGSNPFTMSNTIVINGLSGVGQQANVTATTIASAQDHGTVPVPPAILLLASGLPFAGAMFLRRRKQA